MVKRKGSCRVGAGVVLLLLLCWMDINDSSEAAPVSEKVYTETFRSPSFSLGPGDVIDDYFQVPMPQGHIAIRSFNAQVVDEHGTPIPLHETYLHHWVLDRFYIVAGSNGKGPNASNPVQLKNAGVCSEGLGQWYGLGSETRHTNTTVPPPYGIVVGDPNSVPSGLEEIWVLNVHAIDTRGAIDVGGCAECACDLYNVTRYKNGDALPPGYEGGLDCCYDRSHCAVRLGFEGTKRNLTMEYTVKWVDMTDDIVPVKVYILDVTDPRTSLDEKSACEIEYTVHKCAVGANECLHTKESYAFLPEGGNVVYAVAHQHSGGVGASLYNENGAEICSSIPVYGQGKEAGNETGYIVGMSTCYPEPGTVRIKSGERLLLKSFYDNEKRHTGVMGLFYLLVADDSTVSTTPSPSPRGRYYFCLLMALNITAAVLLIGPIVVCLMRIQNKRVTSKEGYEPIHPDLADETVQQNPKTKLYGVPATSIPDQSFVAIPTSLSS